MSVACVVTWIILRRNYRFWPTVAGTLSAFCLTELVLVQNAEARMYGLFLALCAIGVLEFDVINRTQYCSTSTLLVNALIHAAIVQTHLFGIIYSGAILCAFIIRDRFLNLFRPRVYVSIVVGWLSLIPYIPTFLNQADGGRPRAWIPVPELNDLSSVVVSSGSLFLSLGIMLLLIISVIRFVSRRIIYRNEELPHEHASSAEVSLRVLAFVFLAIPVSVWIVSLTVKPLFVPRYMIPVTLAWAILLAYLASNMIERGKSQLPEPLRRKLLLVVPWVLTGVLLIHPIMYAQSFPKQLFPGRNDAKYEPRDLPIVVSHSDDFLKRFHYSPEPDRYFFVLDWETALDLRSGLFGPQEYKTMDALKRDYPAIFGDHIIQLSDFLSRHDRFLVLADMPFRPRRLAPEIHHPSWIEMRIQNNPAYKTRALGIVDSRRLSLVERIVAASGEPRGPKERP